jgi:hypothetical protein
MAADSQPGERRLMQLDERSVRVATELQAIDEDQCPAHTRTPTGEFDHEAWLEAELRDVMDERKHLEQVVTVEGGVEY